MNCIPKFSRLIRIVRAMRIRSVLYHFEQQNYARIRELAEEILKRL